MKQAFVILFTFLLCTLAHSQEFKYTDAASLTVTGKLMPTSNHYFRLDVEKYTSLSSGERAQATNSAGIAIAFQTDSRYIGVDVCYQKLGGGTNSPFIATRGFDIYIKKNDGDWVWAGNGAPDKVTDGESVQITLIKDAVTGWKECLVYLPLFSTISDLQIVTDEGSKVKLIPNPFKGRIAVFGSSYTHGSGAGRPGMTYCAQLQRMTGYQFINMGFSGNSKLQPYFADILSEAEVDAYLVDAFSNPTPKQMRERLFPFIEKIQSARPGKPIIFFKSIWREKRNFSNSYDAKEAAKAETADSLMRIAVSKYKDVYWVDSTNTIGPNHECTSDGSHPDSHGYTLLAESIKDHVVSILERYLR